MFLSKGNFLTDIDIKIEKRIQSDIVVALNEKEIDEIIRKGNYETK
jgi:ribosomal protein L12E/L44/L45/RPP1/RPP2